MYRVIVSLLLSSSVLVGCANFKSAPQYGVVPKTTRNTDTGCDDTSNLMAVRQCVLNLKNAYSGLAVQLDSHRTSTGGMLIGLAAIGAGNELFKQARDITRTSGLLGGVISSTNAYAPPSTLANVLQNGRSQLECALVKSDQLKAQLMTAEVKYQKMEKTYDDAEDAIALSKAKGSSAEISLLAHAVEAMDQVCNATKVVEFLETPAGADERAVDDHTIARELYATAVSISDQVVGKYRGSYTDTNDAVKQIDEAVTKVKTAFAQAEAMSMAAKTVEEAASLVAPGVECENGKPTADGAKVAADSDISSENANSACEAKQNAEAVVEGARDAANIALTAASLRACAGVQ